jgi:hypothetical protein
MKKLILVVIATASFGLSSAMAGEGKGAFAEVGFGASPLTDVFGTTAGIGLSVGLGYNFNEYVGLEGEAGILGLSTGSSYGISFFSASAIGHLPITDRFSLFGKYGVDEVLVGVSSAGNQSQSFLGAKTLYGGGVEFTAVDKSGIRLGYTHYDLGVQGLTLTSDYYYFSVVNQFN